MSAADEAGKKPSKALWALLPLIVFAVLAGIFLLQLLSGRDNSIIPSALIGQAAPQTVLPPLEGSGLPGLDPASFAGKVTLVNIWASWCAPCREEHPVLMQLAADGRFGIVGLNYKDKTENALRFIGNLGNPYAAIGTDEAGRAAIQWGVYGVPETFVVGKDGTIRYKHVGPITPQALERGLMPAIEEALGG
ncbi:DsbE family thiol:disulfide interchange protein [Mesorhizobium sp. Z1-4]|uniref:DsbE family thiol:disulfide interchange protein n=1 Tax=Mesorhizobium sp. Z1-4 TaxID=2448478 RepID=UPI000FD99E91|nr:DsbE family thiol:disulfide interchange protein [Mesorhizobium sp. Z1-4]